MFAPKWTTTEERTRQTSKEQAQASMRPDISTSLQTAGQFTSIIHLIYSMHLIDCNYAALSVQSHTLCPLHLFTLPNMYICLPILFPLRLIPALHLHYFPLFSPIILSFPLPFTIQLLNYFTSCSLSICCSFTVSQFDICSCIS